MNYLVSPKEQSSLFAIPASIVDDHIKLSSETQLKVLLLFLKNQSEADFYGSAEQKLSLNKAEVYECLDYWVQRGVLTGGGESEQSAEAVKDVSRAEPTAKPTREEAIKRIEDNGELKFLVTIAQEKLARPITAAEYRTFVWIFDQYGLPVPVIVLAMQHAVKEGKGSFSYIEKLCVDWARNNVDTIAKAEDRLNALYLSKTAWKVVSNAFGLPHRKPSKTEEGYANKWVNEYGFTKDMLTLAYEICVDNTSKLNNKYINTVIENWHKKGYKTPADTLEEKVEGKTSPGKNTETNSNFNKQKIKQKLNNFD